MRRRIMKNIGRIGFYFDDMFGTFTIINFVGDYDNPWFIANETLYKLGYSGRVLNANTVIKKYDSNNTSVLLFRQDVTRETINRDYLYILPRGLIIIDKDTFIKILDNRKKNLIRYSVQLGKTLCIII